MAYTRLQHTKGGKAYYEIAVSRGHGKSPYTTRWYVPEGLATKTIRSRLNAFAADFERRCHEGEIETRRDRKEREAKEEAEKRRQQEELEREAAMHMTLKRFSEEEYLPHKRQQKCEEGTLYKFDSLFKSHIYPQLGQTKIDEITGEMLDKFFVWLKEDQNLKYTSCKKDYSLLKNVFEYAMKRKVISANPMHSTEGLELCKDEAAEEKGKAYTETETVHILQCLEKEPLFWRTYFNLLIDTGIRRGEACGLLWEYVDFNAGTVEIKHSLKYTPKTGIVLGTTKTKNQRTVDIGEGTKALLLQLKAQQEKTVPSKYVFAKEDTGDPMFPSTPTWYGRVFGKKYGIDNFHPHRCRHTSASIAITNGSDIASVSERLGHSNKTITLNMYTHSNEEKIKGVGDNVRSVLAEARKKAEK